MLEEEGSNSYFDGHDDLIQSLCRPIRSPKNGSIVARKAFGTALHGFVGVEIVGLKVSHSLIHMVQGFSLLFLV